MLSGRLLPAAFILALMVFVSTACGQEATTSTVVGAQADEAQATEADPTPVATEVPESTEIKPWSADGSAKVIYDFDQKSPPAWEMLVHVEIPLEIEADPTKGKGPWVVTGEKEGVMYATAFGEGAQGLCMVNCDFTGTYTVQGELSLMDAPPNECGFQLNVSAIFDPNKVARSGTCPSIIVDQFGCEVLLQFPQNTGSNPWAFNRASPAMVVKKPNADAEEKLTLSDVELPEEAICVDWEIEIP